MNSANQTNVRPVHPALNERLTYKELTDYMDWLETFVKTMPVTVLTHPVLAKSYRMGIDYIRNTYTHGELIFNMPFRLQWTIDEIYEYSTKE